MNDDMTLKEMEAELATVQKQIARLERQEAVYKGAIGKEKSRRFIAANNIKRSDVQFSRGDGIPWHGDIDAFAKWLKDNNIRKRFCEWNDRLFFTAEMIAGMCANTPGRVSELPE